MDAKITRYIYPDAEICVYMKHILSLSASTKESQGTFCSLSPTQCMQSQRTQTLSKHNTKALKISSRVGLTGACLPREQAAPNI